MDADQGKARVSRSTDDPAFQKSVFQQAFQQTCKAIDDAPTDPIWALRQSYLGRSAALDAVIRVHAPLNNAECQEGCASCCHQMVLCAPFEVFVIARYLLDKKTAIELSEVEARLRRLAELPLDPSARYGVEYPCAFLDSSRCSIYSERPSVCRTMLSASRAACESCLTSKGPGTIPYIAAPMQVDAMMGLGMDYALVSRLNLSTDKVELSRALMIALNDFDETLANWINEGNPFADCQVRPPGFPANRDMVEAAAKRFSVI